MYLRSQTYVPKRSFKQPAPTTQSAKTERSRIPFTSTASMVARNVQTLHFRIGPSGPLGKPLRQPSIECAVGLANLLMEGTWNAPHHVQQ